MVDEQENIEKLKREVAKLEAEKKEKEELERTEKEALALKKKKAQLEYQKTKTYKFSQGVLNVGKKAVGYLGKVGEEITRPKPAQSHPVTQPAKVIQQRIINEPVRQQVQQVIKPTPVQPQSTGYNFDNIFGGNSTTMSSVKAKIQVKRRSRLKKKIGRSYKHKPIRKTLPRIRRINRMPRSPTVPSQPKPFNINDILRGMPQ
jgi:hypothetical protein